MMRLIFYFLHFIRGYQLINFDVGDKITINSGESKVNNEFVLVGEENTVFDFEVYTPDGNNYICYGKDILKNDKMKKIKMMLYEFMIKTRRKTC